MADEKRGHGRVPFQLGRRYKEVGPDLGRLYEAWQVGTGLPGVVLIPSKRMNWQPEGLWLFEMSCQRGPVTIEMVLGQAPPSVHVPELMNVLAMMKAAIERVENNPRLRAHFARGPLFPQEPWTPRVHPERRPRKLHATATGPLLLLLLGVWLRDTNRTEHLEALFSERTLPTDAPALIGAEESQAKIPAYPLPPKPFRNQAMAPCKTRGEIAINGGCWMELAQRPPCYENQAEYQGKCYMPVAKENRLPQSAEP